MNVKEIITKTKEFQKKQKELKEQGKKTFFQKLRWGRIIIAISMMIVFTVGAITIFKWAFIGDGKEVEHKTPIGSYYCKGGAIMQICYTDNNDVYNAYGR